jgi:MFS family permease
MCAVLTDDRWGRRPVLLLSYAGIVLSFSFGPLLLRLEVPISIWLMLIGSTMTLVGGGIPVMINTIYSMASDVSTEETRSSNFLYLGIGAVVASLVAPATAGFLMQTYGPWLPIKIIFATVPFMFLAMLALPETLRIKIGEDDEEDDDGQEEEFRPDLPLGAILRGQVRSGLKDLRSVFAIVKDRNIKLCLLPPLIGNAMWSAGTSTLSQYISKYYGWTLAETTYLMSPLGVVNVLVLAGLPWVSARLVDPEGRYRLSGFKKDLLLLRVAYAIMGFALLIQAISWNIVVLLIGLFFGTLGGVSGPLARAVVTDFVDKKETSRLYAMISIIEMFGAFIGGPVVAAAFTLGMDKGGVLRGLPFFYVSFLCFCALGAMLLVREPKKPRPSTEPDGESWVGDDMGYESAPEDEP